MTSSSIFLISFVSIMGGVMIGLLLRTRLSATHLGSESKEVIRLGTGLLGTLAALVIGLMIASATGFVGVAGLVTAALWATPLGVIVGMSVGMIGAEAMCGPFWAMATKLTRNQAAAGIAIINSVANLGGYFGTFIIGFFRSANGGYEGGMIAIAGVVALSGIIALVVGSEKRQDVV